MKPMTASQQQRYEAACHKMQSGVAAKYFYDTSDTTPKHVRVGINSAMVEAAALATILVDKGVCTEDEYFEALIAQMEVEANMYEAEVSSLMQANVRLC